VSNPGSRAICQTFPQVVGEGIDPLQVFESFFVSCDACVRGFISGCRLFVGLDGCHLKTTVGRILLCAVGRDENNQIFSLAVVVVKVENYELDFGSWTT